VFFVDKFVNLLLIAKFPPNAKSKVELSNGVTQMSLPILTSVQASESRYGIELTGQVFTLWCGIPNERGVVVDGKTDVSRVSQLASNGHNSVRAMRLVKGNQLKKAISNLVLLSAEVMALRYRFPLLGPGRTILQHWVYITRLGLHRPPTVLSTHRNRMLERCDICGGCLKRLDSDSFRSRLTGKTSKGK
jgi:hypothetical protein